MDDMVSRKAVIDAVHTATYGFICGAEDGDEMTDADKLVLSINKAVCTAIKALPSVQPRWIPVTERLPEHSGFYIVTTVICDDGKLVGLRWFSQEHGWEFGKNPLAWMPIPEPYAERRQDE